MNTSEIFDPTRRKKKVVESFLNSQFGVKLAAAGDKVSIHSLINKLVKENAEMANRVANFENSADYVKNSMIIEALRTMLSEIAPARTSRKVNEETTNQDLEQAELILVAKSMIEKLQAMAEDVAEMQTDDLMALEEKIKVTFSQEQGEAFSQAVDASLATLLEAIKAAKDAVSQATAILSGEEAGMPAAMPSDMSMEPEEDTFAADDAARGPEEEPTARELK
jgi:hypothetical protein